MERLNEADNDIKSFSGIRRFSMKKIFKTLLPLFAVFVLFTSKATAQTVKKLDFTGVTNTEKVIITIDDNNQIIEYQTPSRTTKFVILDYNYVNDVNTDDKVLSCTALDPLYSTACQVVLYSNGNYSDIRIGKKQITFKYVPEFAVTQ